MVPVKCDTFASVLHSKEVLHVDELCHLTCLQCFFIFHCFAVETTTKMTLSHFILKIQMLYLGKACSAVWLERAALCQSLAEFFEKE